MERQLHQGVCVHRGPAKITDGIRVNASGPEAFVQIMQVIINNLHEAQWKAKKDLETWSSQVIPEKTLNCVLKA